MKKPTRKVSEIDRSTPAGRRALKAAGVVLPGQPGARKKAAKPRVRKTTENDETCLQMHCWQWVSREHPGLLIFHVANERKGSIGAAMHFKRMGVLPGVADFLAFTPGRAFAIELKDDAGDQRANQQHFEKRWTRAGNVYVVVRTLDEFKGAIAAMTLFGT